jgi:uncharacterized membrane protein
MRKKKKKDILIIVTGFLFPILLGFSIILFVGIILGNETQIKYWSLITGYFFPPLGKETVIPAGIAIGFNPILMSLSIAFVDIVVALFLVWNYDLAKKIPFVEKFITKIENSGKNIEDKYGWIKPLRFIGIILFVMVPFQGSGGLVGSIVGRLIGMKPWNTFLAISIGAIVGTLLVATFSKVFLEFAKINNLLTLVLIAIIAIIIIVHYLHKNRVNKKN